MKTSATLLLTIALVTACCTGGYAEFRAGAAFRVVNPDPLLPVTGGTGGVTPVKERKGDLTVRALVWEQGDVRIAVVGADFLGFPAVLGDKVRQQVPRIPPQNILIGSTHTHSAPDTYGFADESGQTGADLKYLDSVCARMAEAINEALDKLQPAAVKIATGKAMGKIAYNYYAPQLYDPRMSVIQCVTASGGAPIATLVNYATHPEVLGSDQGILSPDLCGPLYDRIAAKGGGMGLFMNSAQGGMVTADCRGPEGDVQTWDECVRIGNLMADEAFRILESARIQNDPALFCGAATVTFPVESDIMKAILASSPLGYAAGPGGTVSTQVNLVNLGNAQILTVPGEALPNIGYHLKRKMHGEHNLLFGLTNDAFGYILTKVDWSSFDRYEYITRTSLGENTGEIFIEQALKFVDACPRPSRVD